MADRDTGAAEDDRPPICPACGVTMGMSVDAGTARFVCLECGFSDDSSQPGPAASLA